MKVKTVKPFFDIAENVDRSVGDVFEVDEKRAGVLIGHEVGALVEKVVSRPAKKQSVKTDG
ncbi:MAG: hypothetical protein RR772_07175 [Gordonibacter sp.]